MGVSTVVLRQFQSTLPVRGATSGEISLGQIEVNFNPRSPCGERRTACVLLLRHRISIHAPRAGSDSNFYQNMSLNFGENATIFARKRIWHRSPTGNPGEKLPFPQIFGCEPAGKLLITSPLRSEDQRSFRLITVPAAEVLDLIFAAFPQVVKPQAVFFRVHDGQQLGLQHLARGSIPHT